jgi:NADPH:quinone reductase-like Zn-dependent oxidoreductase
MNACFFRRYGGPEVLEYGELPDPVPGAGEVLIDVHAASVNAADWRMRAGQYGTAISFPHVPGRDFSGVVDKAAGDLKARSSITVPRISRSW